jgi:cysteine-rich repeat protein
MTYVKNILFTLLLATPFAGCGTSSSTSSASGIEGATLAEGSSLAEESETDCAFTQGFWKNHPESWPVDSLTLGSVQYTKAQVLSIFGQPVKGNGLVALAHQLCAAKLNVANGSDASDINDEVAAADALIGNLMVPPVGTGSLSPSSASALVNKLDEFNNFGECWPDDEPVCGNGVVEEGEDCDDGNTSNDDACHNDCTGCPAQTPVCGNGTVETGEECDDGNRTDGDGCSSVCKKPAPPPAPVCGNGVVETGEECDDGNRTDGDGCSSVCKKPAPPPGPVCGNGVLEAGEECDDGNHTDGDGCSSTCTIILG